MKAAESIRLLNTSIHCLTESQVLKRVRHAIEAKQSLRIGVVNGAKLVAMQSNQLLYDDVTSSDLVLADGMSVVWASRIVGQPLPERIAGIDLMFRFFELANQNRYRIYCLGATSQILAQVVENIHHDYPDLILAGHHDGYFTDDEADEIAHDIAGSKPHILLVAMTSPKKENFMGKWDDVIQVPIVHGVGGSFDVYAGKVERAPLAWQKLGLEWLYRVKQEPRRLWKRYAITNTLFCWLLLKDVIRGMAGRVSRN